MWSRNFKYFSRCIYKPIYYWDLKTVFTVKSLYLRWWENRCSYFEPLSWNKKKKKKGNITFNFLFTFPSYFPFPSLISSFRLFSLYHIMFSFHPSLFHLFFYLLPSPSLYFSSFFSLPPPFNSIRNNRSTLLYLIYFLHGNVYTYINRTQFRLCVETPRCNSNSPNFLFSYTVIKS